MPHRLTDLFVALLVTVVIQKVLAASYEYDPAHNSRMAFRAQDNDEVVKLTKELTTFEKNIKNEWPYRVKARAVLAAHMEDIPLPADTLEKGVLCLNLVACVRYRARFSVARVVWYIDLNVVLLSCRADRQYMVRMCPYLLSELINMGMQAFFMVKSGQGECVKDRNWSIH